MKKCKVLTYVWFAEVYIANFSGDWVGVTT